MIDMRDKETYKIIEKHITTSNYTHVGGNYAIYEQFEEHGVGVYG